MNVVLIVCAGVNIGIQVSAGVECSCGNIWFCMRQIFQKVPLGTLLASVIFNRLTDPLWKYLQNSFTLKP